MAFQHGKGSVFKLDDAAGALQDISAFLTSVGGLEGKSDRPDTTTFGQAAMRRQVLGLRDGGPISIEGFWQPTTAAKVHGRNARILLDQYALSGYLQEGSISRKHDVPETQTFGDNWRERGVVALLDGSVSFSGLFESAAGASDAVFRALLAQEAGAILSLGLNGFAIGSLVDMVQIVEGTYEIPAAVEDLVTVSAEFEADDRIDLGVALHDQTAETVAANYASVDETAGTTGGGVGHLHVTAFTSGSATIKIQHSPDNSIWADLITFTAAAGVTKQRIEVSGTVDRYVRATSTGTFSLTFVVAFARRGFTYGSAGTYRHLCGLYGLAASSSYEYGPEGGTTGKRKLSGESRLSSLEVSFSEEDVIKFTGELVADGAVTEGTFA